MSSNVLIIDEFIKMVYTGVIERKKAHKNDAYFDVTDDITHDDIKNVIKRLKDEYGISSRLYSPYRLQVFWDNCPRTNIFEYICETGPLMDPDDTVQLYSMVFKE